MNTTLVSYYPLHARRLAGLLLAAAALAPMSARAADDNPSAPPPAPAIANGEDAHAWLKLQETGTQASKQKQTLSGPAMTLVYARYLESFRQPIHSDSDKKSLFTFK